MSNTLFNSYSVKGNLKFYKNNDENEKITISIGISANHQINENIYDDLNEFLEKLLIEDYHNEEIYTKNKEVEKAEKEEQKKRVKYAKEKEKECKANMKKNTSATNIKKQSSRSIY